MSNERSVQNYGMLDGQWWSSPHLTNGVPCVEVLKQFRTLTYLAGPKAGDWSVLAMKIEAAKGEKR